MFFDNGENEDILKEQNEAYERLYNAMIYFVLIDNWALVEKKFKKFMDYKTIKEILIVQDEKDEELIAVRMLKKELLMSSKGEKNTVHGKEEIIFLNTVEGLFKVNLIISV